MIYPAFLLTAGYLAIYAAAILIYYGFFTGRYATVDEFMAAHGEPVSISALLFALGSAFWIYRKDNKAQSGTPVSFTIILRAIIMGMLAGHGLGILVSLINYSGFLGNYVRTEQILKVSGIVMATVKAVLLAPLAEEIAFRGLVFKRGREYMSFWPAALTSSLFFALYHMNLTQGIYAFMYGLLLCAIYDKIRNLWVPIAMHAAANALALALQLAGIDYPRLWMGVVMMIATLGGCYLLLRKSLK
ncbi:MAG: CPBP family intramembrane glutamic endopeptidase [Lachnospiraceae bacterium]